MENPTLAVEYMSIVELRQVSLIAICIFSGLANIAQVVSPKSKLRSAHEGQIVLTATYSAHAAHNKKEFEDGLKQLLEVDGKLCAWQKISATEAGTFRLIAEFCDIKKAKQAIARCNGKDSKVIVYHGLSSLKFV